MESLCLFAVGALLVTVVGHGLWRLFAKIFASLRPEERSAREEPPDRCRNCREMIPYHARRCPECGLTRDAGAKASDLRVVVKQLQAFRSAGEIDGETYWRMLDMIRAREGKLAARGKARRRFEPTEQLEDRSPSTIEPTGQEPEPKTTREEAPPAADPSIEIAPLPDRSRDSAHRPEISPPPLSESALALEMIRESDIPPPSTYAESALVLEMAGEPENVPPLPDRSRDAARQMPFSPPAFRPPVLRGPFAPQVGEPEVVEPEKPRVSWGEWLGTFLEQRNIFWGELVGGLLIVGCSIALILSLLQTLESIPLFPFLAAAMTTGALYGAGRYSLSYWKLESSSRGLLVIATLLVPLNFLVLAGISPRSNNPLEIGAKILAVLVFAVMVRSAGRVLLPVPAGWRSRSRGWLLSLAMVGPALAPLLAARAYDPDGSQLPFGLLISLAVACHAIAIAGTVVAYRRAGAVGIAAAPVLGWVGFSFYSVAVSLAFLAFYVAVSRGGNVSVVFGPLAGPAVIAGACILAAGLFVQRRAAAAPEEKDRSSTVGVIATGVALLGGLVQVAAFGLAWPDRGALLFVGLANYAILTGVAIRFRFPPAQLPALPSLLISFLAGVSLIAASGAPLGTNAGLTGTALAGLAIALSIVADRFLGAGRTLDGRAYQIAAGVIALLSLGLVGADALSDPLWATLAGSVYALACIVLSRRWGLPVLEQIGIALLPLTTAVALHWGMPGRYPAWGTVLALEALAFSIARGSWWRPAAFAAVLAMAAVGFGRTEFNSVWNTATAFVLAAGVMVHAGRWRLMQLTWAAVALSFAGIAHGLILSAGAPLLLPWATVFLVFASSALLASLVGLKRSVYPLREVFALPLRWSGLAATIAAAVNLLTGVEQSLLGPQAIFVSWLAVVWLVAALSEREAPWFVAFQVAAMAAAALGVGFALQEQARAAGTAVSFTSAAAMYAFGLGLGGIAVCWALLRRLLERRDFFRVFFGPANIFDYLLLGALIAAQLALAGWLVIPEVLREVGPIGAIEINEFFRPETLFALGTQPWLLLGLLGAALALYLRGGDSKRTTALLAGLGCLAVSAPLLAAGRFAPELASASALRWCLTGACLLIAVPFWLRRRESPDTVTASPGTILSIVIALPVLALSAISTAIILSGHVSAGPATGSFFANLGWSFAHGLPVAALAVMLLGHAIRERIGRHALAAGILLTLSAGFGHAVESVLAGASFDIRVIAEALQRATTAAALMSAAWIVAVFVARRRSEQSTETWPPLWLGQQGIAIGGNVPLLGGASLSLALALPANAGPTIPPTYPDAALGVTAIAGAWGWVALILTIGAGWLGSSFTRRKVSPDLFALSLSGIVAMTAAVIAGVAPDWAFRTLMYGAAALALAAAWAARRSGAFDHWVAIAGSVAVVLAAKATLVHGDSLAAIPASAIASFAGLWLSLRRARADWACLAGLGVQLSVATALWHGFRPMAMGEWATYLVQACVAAAALLLLLDRWLRNRGRAGPSLFTQFQQAIIVVGLMVLFALPIAQLMVEPALNPTLLAQQSGAPSGLGMLLLVAVSIVVFIRRHARACFGDILGTFAILAIIWLALAASGYWPGWPAYHTLMIGMAVAALSSVFLKGDRAENWTRAFALVVAGLALRAAWIDPFRPYFSTGAALLTAAVFSVHAIRRNRLADIWASCGLFCLAGFFVWVKWGTESAPHLIAMETACVAAAAIIWHGLARKFSVPFRENAVAISAMLIALLALWGFIEASGATTRQIPSDIAWIAAALAIVAALVGFATPALRSASASLYGLSLCIALFGLLQPRWPLEEMLRPAVVALGGFVLLAQIVEWFGSRRMDRDAAQWFFSAQLGIAGVVVLLSLPACLGTGPLMERLAGPLALGLLGITIAMLATRCVGPRARSLEHAVFGAAALLCAEIGWALTDPNGSGAWLHGSVSLLAALCLAALIAALLVPRLAAAENRWVQAARRSGPVLGLLGVGVLAIVLLQEFYFFDRSAGGLPLSGFEALVVAAAMIGLIAAAIAFAIRPGLDPFGLSGSGRKGYVYAAEAVLALLFLHFRLSIPDLAPPPVGGIRWAFMLMLIAFAGIGLAEFFRRRNLEVLADPIHRTGIFLPLLPLVAFWLVPAPNGLSRSFQNYSLLWLTAGLLYGVLAMTQRSYRYVLATALAMNAALWAFYAHEGVGFLVHPQVWLVPLALIVLVSEFFHRDRLTPELAAGLRYGGLAMLYISSMADVFVAGPNESAPLLFVLAVLSVLGVFAGILVRVRAYLFLGSGFLTLVVFRMIWHAAVEREQTWVWWVCGIVLGVLVLTLFAVLERRGQKVRAALERFRQWR